MIQPSSRTLATILLLHALAPGQGVFAPEPLPRDRRIGPFEPAVVTGLLRIKTSIVDGTASTELLQTIENRSGVAQEAWWMLPLPPGAAADRFAMTVDGVTTASEVLDAQRARGIYEEIVRKRRDPGLLEYLGSGLLRARVFPIPPLGKVEVSVRYAELLAPSDTVTTWRFPLRAAWTDGSGPQRLSVAIDLRSKSPIKTIWSPLANLDIVRDDDRHVRASAEFERGSAPPRDLALHYGTSEQDFGVHLLTCRRAGEAGFFLMLLAPKREWPTPPELARSINLVVDTSGSMAGEKIAQARAAVRQFLQSLSPRDWFNVIPFSTDPRPFFPEPVSASKEHIEQALAKVEQLVARGGTNIDEALATALRNAAPADAPGTLVPITVFLTDGLPTVGTTDVDALLQQARAGNGKKARLFVLGVGHDVNTRLLDTLAADSRGDRDYVQPGENIESKTSALFSKLSGPVMTDLRLTVEGIELQEQEPRLLPDLFVQGQIAVVGRFQGAGHHAIRLRGKVGAAEQEYVFEGSFPAVAADCDWLPALWAQKKVAALLDAIRLHGAKDELVTEVTRLGKEFGIVTPYTSHLVVEEGTRVARSLGREQMPVDERVQEALRREWARSGAPAQTPAADLPQIAAEAQREASVAAVRMLSSDESGGAAVGKSQDLQSFAKDRLAQATGSAALVHRRVAGRSFHLVAGVWVDAGLTAAMKDRMVKVEAFSADYFALLQQRPQLARLLAFSTRMVIVDGSDAFEIVDAP